jgi:hypothetical protein
VAARSTRHIRGRVRFCLETRGQVPLCLPARRRRHERAGGRRFEVSWMEPGGCRWQPQQRPGPAPPDRRRRATASSTTPAARAGQGGALHTGTSSALPTTSSVPGRRR